MEKTVEAKLKQLFEVQLIDSKIDKLHAVRGELPMEVADLEDEIEGLNTRIEKLNSDIEQLNSDIDDRKNAIKESEALVKRYDGQLEDVKNNREYLALTKEIELQKLEKMAAEKKIKDLGQQIEDKKELIEESTAKLDDRKKDLDVKKNELESISEETRKEEEALNAERNTVMEDIEERLTNAYRKLREGYPNGLAVVTIERESCGGCFSVIPPQRRLDIGNRKKIIVCEHCGRILVDNELSEDVKGELAKTING